MPLSDNATVTLLLLFIQTGFVVAPKVLVNDAGLVFTVTVNEQVAVLPDASVAE